jgi:hypothetical protein
MRFIPVGSRPVLPGRHIAKSALLAGVVLSLTMVPTTADDAVVTLFAPTRTSSELPLDQVRGARIELPEAPASETSGEHREFRSEPIKRTVLFVNGQLVAPPLVVTTEQSRVLVNGVELSIDKAFRRALGDTPSIGGDSGLDLAETMPDDESGERRRSRKRRSSADADFAIASDDADDEAAVATTTWKTAEAVTSWLDSGNGVAVVFEGQQPTWFIMTNGGLELLTALQSRGKDRVSMDFVLKQLQSGVNSDIYLNWITGFETSPTLDGLVAKNAELISETESRNQSATAAIIRLRVLSYPMSVVGLLLSVFAFGHVVSNKPPNRFAPSVAELTPETREMVNRCLLLVVALSILDLIWTILASQANQMAELNPMGREFIRNPALLGAFKFVMTGIGVGLLFALKQHRIAQTAAWWACMILTLLTMRWLTFNSMFA